MRSDELERPVASVSFVYTRDLDRAARFFSRTLTLPLVIDQGPCRLYRVSDTSLWGVCELADRPQDPAGVTLTMVFDTTDAVDAAYASAAEKGAEVAIRPRYSERFGVYAGLLLSPDGHRVEMQTLNGWRA